MTPLGRFPGAAVLAATAFTVLVGCASHHTPATRSAAPAPVSPASTAPAAHLAPADHCPARDPALTAAAIPADQRATDGQLAPPNPVGGVLCRYVPLNRPRPAGTLAQSLPLTAGQAATLAALTNAGDLAPKATYACPSSEGMEDVAIFRLADGTARRVDYAMDGCSWASNGSVQRWIGDGLRRELVELIGNPAPPTYPTTPG